MNEPKCCWKCENLISYNPEEDKCKLDGHIFEDKLCLSTMRDKECPLDKNELKGEQMTTQMVDKSNFDNNQYKADLQCAYDCGYVKGQNDILEKLKTEINNGYPTSVEDILWIIDNKMSELKEENKLTCDRNICLKNEYSNIGCEDCVVTKGEQK